MTKLDAIVPRVFIWSDLGNWTKTKKRACVGATWSEINEKQKKREVIVHFVKRLPINALTASPVDESRLKRRLQTIENKALQPPEQYSIVVLLSRYSISSKISIRPKIMCIQIHH